MILSEIAKASMKSSLAKLSQLPGKTRVFCGHEYTVSRSWRLNAPPTERFLEQSVEQDIQNPK